MSIKVLVAENEKMNAYLLKTQLSNWGYEVHVAYNGMAAWILFNKVKFDICLLDIMMPLLDGFELTTKIRKVNTRLPIIYLSGMAGQDDIIKGLETGADDYITKPVNLTELVLRMEVFLKRARRVTGRTYFFGKYDLDTEKFVLTIGNMRVGLPLKEVKILSVLVKNIGTTVTRENIIQEVWNKSEGKIERPLHIFIHRIRKRLKADPRVEIETIRNVGYRLQVFDGIS